MTSLSFLRQMLHDVRHQKVRTLLTLFGTTWGTVSVALLVAFGEGLERHVVESQHGLGENIVTGGRFIHVRDMAEKRRVVVLGDQLALDLFGRQDVVGQSILINGGAFLVIGVMEPKVMMGMYSGPDKSQASIPATTFKSLYTDARLDNLVYKPTSMELGDQVKAEIYRVLSRKYRFDPEDTRAIGIWDTRENQRITDNISIGIQLFLGVIGVLTLPRAPASRR